MDGRDAFLAGLSQSGPLARPTEARQSPCWGGGGFIDHILLGGAARGWLVEGSLRYRLTRALETHAIKRVAGLIVICEGLRQEMLSRGARPESLAVAPNAVDVERFKPIMQRDAALENRLGLVGMDVVGFVGSFYDYEGLDDLIDATALLAREMPALRVLLIGGSIYEKGDDGASGHRIGRESSRQELAYLCDRREFG